MVSAGDVPHPGTGASEPSSLSRFLQREKEDPCEVETGAGVTSGGATDSHDVESGRPESHATLVERVGAEPGKRDVDPMEEVDEDQGGHDGSKAGPKVRGRGLTEGDQGELNHVYV